MERTIFEPEHEEFRATARKYFETECVPHVEEWEAQGHASREAWLKAGELGLLGWERPEEYGGADIKDFRFNAIISEEYNATGSVGIGLGVQNDILCGYFRDLTTDEQKKRWLPQIARGEKFVAFCLSEKFAGSDAGGLSVTAVEDGDDYVICGEKKWTTNGGVADIYSVFCVTDPNSKSRRISAIVVEKGTPGFTVKKVENKMGIRCVPVSRRTSTTCAFRSRT